MNRRYLMLSIGVALALWVQASTAEVILNCQPDATVVTAGQVIEVTCTISQDGKESVEIAGVQVDLPCSIPLVGAGSGSISTAPIAATECSESGDCPGTIVSGNLCQAGSCVPVFVDPIHGGFPGDTIFGFAGIYPVNQSACVAAAAPALGNPVISLAPGEDLYIATIVYEVSACAAGTFRFGLENFSNPPDSRDQTKIRDTQSPSELIPFREVAHLITVETGQCCDNSVCLGDLNEQCCRDAGEATRWDAAETCSKGGCGCSIDSDCDDGNLCTRNSCDARACLTENVASECDDGLFCTTVDACQDGFCVGSGDACLGRVCDEQQQSCVNCLTDNDCDDSNGCTDDTCENASCVYTPNSDDCNDGRFCTVSDNCQGGQCLGIGTTCPGSFCDEEADRCVECQDDVHCDDDDVCTDDACIADVCEHAHNTASCDDGLFCTLDDACSQGACVGTGSPCTGGCDEKTKSCADLGLVSSDPPHGAIDARQPSDITGTNPVGWDRITMTFSGPVADMVINDFSVLQQGGNLPAPAVASLDQVDIDIVDVVLNGRVEPGSWLTVTHDPSGASVRIGSLPADVGGDGTSSALDILKLIDFLNGIGDPLPIWSTDINRSDETNATDIIREIDLLNGADAFETWNQVSLPATND